MVNQALRRMPALNSVLTLGLLLVLCLPSLASSRPRAVRGQSRLLKKTYDDEAKNPYDNDEVLGGFGIDNEGEQQQELMKFNEPDEEGTENEEVEEEEEEEKGKGDYQGDYNEQNPSTGGFGAEEPDSEDEDEAETNEKNDKENDKGNGNDNDNDKDVEKDNYFDDGDFTVRLPELGLVVRVEEAAPSNRFAVETLIEEYFENLLSKNVMGFNYVSASYEAEMVRSQNFAYPSGNGVYLYFIIRGEAEFDGDPVPGDRQISERLTAYFIDWGNDGDLGSFLATNGGIQGARAANFLVNGVQMPAFTQPNSNINGPSSSSFPSGMGTNTIPTTEDADDAFEDEDSSGGNNAGLITGLFFFFLALIVAGVLLFRARRELVSEFCSSRKDDAIEKADIKKSRAKRGWQDFKDDDGSDTAPSRGESDTALKFKLPCWLSRRQNNKEEEEKETQPSQILGQISVIVDNDHVLKQGSRYRTYTLPEEAIVSHQHSEATIPHSNFGGIDYVSKGGPAVDCISPQKTANTCPSDEDELSLPSPVGRWEPPTRSKSKMYRERRRGEDQPQQKRREQQQMAGNHGAPENGSPPPHQSNVTKSPKSHQKPRPPPENLEVEDDGECNALTDWTTFLNPCMLPNLPMFQYESERLDDLVANLPNRQRSVLDSSADSSTSPSPPRRPPPPPPPPRRSGGRPPSGRAKGRRLQQPQM